MQHFIYAARSSTRPLAVWRGPIPRHFFGSYALQDPSKELFIKRCTDLIERRGHRFIRVGVKRVTSKGKTEVFDITYGWPIRYYCRCNFSDNPVQSSELKQFEVGLCLALYRRNR